MHDITSVSAHITSGLCTDSLSASPSIWSQPSRPSISLHHIVSLKRLQQVTFLYLVRTWAALSDLSVLLLQQG